MTPENLIPPTKRWAPPVHEATGGYGFPHAIPTRVPHKTLLFFGGGE